MHCVTTRAGRRSCPMEIVRTVAVAMQHVLGPEVEDLGRTSQVIQRRCKFSAVSLLRMLVLTLLKKPDAKPDDSRTTAAPRGVEVSQAAIEKRFSPPLIVFLRGALERALQQVL